MQVPSNQQLGKLLNNFKEGNTHMAMVIEANTTNPDTDPFYELKVSCLSYRWVRESLGPLGGWVWI